MKKWRLLPHNLNNYYYQMALDEAILLSVASNKSPPTLRFYHWIKPAVSIGYFQSVKKGVNIANCKKDKVAIFRRMTGGGAVYKDPKGEINYSLIIKENDPLIPSSIVDSYRAIEQGLITGLAYSGLKTEYSGINDVVLNGKKISGNAQTRKNGAILQHGTILLDFDVEKMIRYLNISADKISDKGIKDIKSRVGTIKQYAPNLSAKKLEMNIIWFQSII